ncbi:MAG: hypothetical protein WD598_03030 [Acidimicrobiia bacterium]
MSAQSTIQLERASKFMDRIRKYQVFVDAEEVGTIKNGESVSFPIAPGRHEVVLLIDWASCPPVTIDAKPGGTVRMACRPKANPLNALYYVLFAREKYLELDVIG